jgi:hypothetical protein
MKKSTILMLLLSLFLTACAQHNGAVVIRTQPEGAEIVDVKSGVSLGVTPLTYWWRDDDSTQKFVNIRAQKEGYRDKTNSFWVDLRHKSRDEALENAQPVDMIMDQRQ